MHIHLLRTKQWKFHRIDNKSICYSKSIFTSQNFTLIYNIQICFWNYQHICSSCLVCSHLRILPYMKKHVCSALQNRFGSIHIRLLRIFLKQSLHYITFPLSRSRFLIFTWIWLTAFHSCRIPSTSFVIILSWVITHVISSTCILSKNSAACTWRILASCLINQINFTNKVTSLWSNCNYLTV